MNEYPQYTPSQEDLETYEHFTIEIFNRIYKFNSNKQERSFISTLCSKEWKSIQDKFWTQYNEFQSHYSFEIKTIDIFKCIPWVMAILISYGWK